MTLQRDPMSESQPAQPLKPAPVSPGPGRTCVMVPGANVCVHPDVDPPLAKQLIVLFDDDATITPSDPGGATMTTVSVKSVTMGSKLAVTCRLELTVTVHSRPPAVALTLSHPVHPVNCDCASGIATRVTVGPKANRTLAEGHVSGHRNSPLGCVVTTP